MLRVKPFPALRPRADLCPRVASVPYDVVDRREAYALAHDNPYSFLHVSRSEIDLPEGADPYSPEVYRKAAAQFLALQQNNVLIRDSAPSFYIYRLTRNNRSQHGIVACCSARDYETNIIRKHEHTRPDKEEDRTRHTAALRAHSGPVFLIFRDDRALDNLTAAAERQDPLYDFTAPDGVTHTVWQVAGTAPFVEAFGSVPAAYIADGHHRAAAAVRVARELRGHEGADPESAGADFFLAVLFPASQLEILPYNRVVRDLGGMDKARFIEEVKARFEIESGAPPAPSAPGRISMYFDKRWHSLAPRRAPANDPVASLDVSILQSGLLGPVLGIADPRTDKRLEFVGGIHGTAELERRVAEGRAVAFSLYPASVAQLLAVSDAGLIMPPKSTWFEPKLRDALLIHTF